MDKQLQALVDKLNALRNLLQDRVDNAGESDASQEKAERNQERIDAIEAAIDALEAVIEL